MSSGRSSSAWARKDSKSSRASSDAVTSGNAACSWTCWPAANFVVAAGGDGTRRRDLDGEAAWSFSPKPANLIASEGGDGTRRRDLAGASGTKRRRGDREGVSGTKRSGGDDGGGVSGMKRPGDGGSARLLSLPSTLR